MYTLLHKNLPSVYSEMREEKHLAIATVAWHLETSKSMENMGFIDFL